MQELALNAIIDYLNRRKAPEPPPPGSHPD